VIGASSDVRLGADRALYLERGMIEVDGHDIAVATARFTAAVDGDATITPARVIVQRGGARVTQLDAAASDQHVDSRAPWTVPDAPVTPAPAPAHPAPTAGDALALARRAYAAGKFADAKRSATAALAASASRAQSAEAHTIVAECAQATGDLDAAAARYALIAARYADLSAGETALFAAAHLAAARHAGDAAQLYDRYLTRYPTGRFADDARRERAHL